MNCPKCSGPMELCAKWDDRIHYVCRPCWKYSAIGGPLVEGKMQCLIADNDYPFYRFKCTKGHIFDVDPSDETNTTVIDHPDGGKVQIETCPECGEKGDPQRYVTGSSRSRNDNGPSDQAEGHRDN